MAIGIQSAYSGKDKRLFKSEDDEKYIDPYVKKDELDDLYMQFGVVK